jgi:P4 family phage/plasmid primase-like protien
MEVKRARVDIEDIDRGRIYTANGKTIGPFTHEQETNPELDSRIATQLGVPILAIDEARLRRHTFNVDAENEPPILEVVHAEHFDESTQPHIIARAVLAEKHIVTTSDNGEMYDYNPSRGLFRLGAEVRIAKALEHTFRRLEAEKALRISVMREVVERIKRRTYTSREELNKDPFILNVQNGILDLRTRELLPHGPKYHSTVQLQVKYDPLATCPAIMKFLQEVLYKEDIPAIQELLGYVLWRDYPAAKAWMLVGTGANGKSTFIALLKTLLGIENVSSRGLIDLEKNRFATADLYGKLANLYADLEDVALKSTGKFKMLTGRDPVTAEFKFRNSFPFLNIAKMVFSCNKIPEAVDDTDAFFRRWVIITFPNQFLGNREDRNLLAKLTTPEELSGLLNFALEGLKRLQSNGWHFSNPKTTTEIRREYIRKSSPVQAFLMDCTKLDVDGLVSRAQLFSQFSAYCHTHQLPVPSSDSFFKKLPEINPNLGKFYGPVPNGPVTAEGKPKRVHCVKGLIVLPTEEWGNGGDEEDDSETKDSESPAHPEHPERIATLDNLVQRVQGEQGSSHSNVSQLGTQEGREAAAGFLAQWCNDLDLALLPRELVTAGYTRDLAQAERFVKEISERGLLGGPK